MYVNWQCHVQKSYLTLSKSQDTISVITEEKIINKSNKGDFAESEKKTRQIFRQKLPLSNIQHSKKEELKKKKITLTFLNKLKRTAETTKNIFKRLSRSFLKEGISTAKYF